MQDTLTVKVELPEGNTIFFELSQAVLNNMIKAETIFPDLGIQEASFGLQKAFIQDHASQESITSPLIWKRASNELFLRWEIVDLCLGSISSIEGKFLDKIQDLLRDFNNIPPDFDSWGIVINDSNWAMAHEAAQFGLLPDEFDRWELATDTGWTVAHEAAVFGNLPDGFDQWRLRDVKGHTVAYVAATNGHLPDSFEQWNLPAEAPDQYNCLFGHIAAARGWLPAHFVQWDLANPLGWTVAHEAAVFGNLPEDFDRWDLADCDGRTVAHVAATHGRLPENFDQWELTDDFGWTVAHEAATMIILPADFAHWETQNKNGLSVAQIAAECGNLPDGINLSRHGILLKQ